MSNSLTRGSNFALSTLSSLFRGVTNKTRSISVELNKRFQELYSDENGHRVIDEDWDFLIILDSCRYDTFCDANWFEGKLRSRYSAEGNSWEFIRKNFATKQFHDTVCISANPNTANLDENTFHSHELIDNRDGLPISPKELVDIAAQTVDKYPDKRIIFYFMEPHYPYTDEYGLSLVEEYTSGSYGEEVPLDWPIGAINWNTENSPPADEVRKAYRQNLEYGLDAVEDLIPKLNGKTVVTSDHGELLGERLFPIPVTWWGHEERIRHRDLRKVPWFVIESESRRTITSDPPKNNDTPTDGEIESRLQALGYK